MAEIIRDFMQFYKMEHSLSVFQAEMGLSTDFPMQKFEIERQADITDKDTSKPLMLKLLEKAKFGSTTAPGASSPEQSRRPTSNKSPMSSPSPNSKPENQKMESKRQS